MAVRAAPTAAVSLASTPPGGAILSEVSSAVDGEDALVRARELDPDLVLLDVMNNTH